MKSRSSFKPRGTVDNERHDYMKSSNLETWDKKDVTAKNFLFEANLHPYKLQLVPGEIFQFLSIVYLISSQILNNTFFPYEIHFHPDEYVIKRNFGCWSSEYPQFWDQAGVHFTKVSVFVGIVSFGFINSHYFDLQHQN